MCDWILGATMIDAAGRPISSGGRTLKNVSGYDLTRLAWRSRGALVMSAAFILKLLPRPKACPVLEWTAPSPAEAGRLAERAILAKIRPEALRYEAGPGGQKLVAWLCGFPEMVDHQKGLLADLLGSPAAELEDGFAYFRERSASWSADAPSPVRASRRALVDWLADLEIPAGPPEGFSVEIDFGGRQALLGPAVDRSALAAPAGPDRTGNLVRRLKAAVDPGQVFWPLSQERPTA